MEGLTAGRIVHYVNSKGYHRAAQVVGGMDQEQGSVNLLVSYDLGDSTTSNDGVQVHSCQSWVDLVPYDETGQNPISWHWIERA